MTNFSFELSPSSRPSIIKAFFWENFNMLLLTAVFFLFSFPMSPYSLLLFGKSLYSIVMGVISEPFTTIL